MPICFHSYMILTLLSIHIPPGMTEEPSIMRAKAFFEEANPFTT
jgi:hypothetical protein